MRFLLFKVYESGTCNTWMSIEIAIGLAKITNRKLVLYGSGAVKGDLKTLEGGRYHYNRTGFEEIISQNNRPKITDLLEKLSLLSLNYSDLILEFDIDNAKKVQKNSEQLLGCIFLSNENLGKLNGAVESKRLKDFRGERKILTDPDKEIWHIDGNTLTYYSRFFFDPPASLFLELEKIKPAVCYEDLAQKISSSLGYFNGVHIRLTDFKKFRPQDVNYSSKIIDILQGSFRKDTRLVIGTDESENSEFFEPLIKAFPNSVFLDHWILENFSKEFKMLPFRDEQTLGLISNITLWDSQEFAGTLGSTFTGFIHRNWARKISSQKKSRGKNSVLWRFTNHGYDNRLSNIYNKFENGVFLDIKSGHYSWNRIDYPENFGSPSWVREWPEALGQSEVLLDSTSTE